MLQRCREVLIVAALMLIAKSGYALQRGAPVGEGLYPAVVKIIIADGISGPEHCTGTIVKKKFILTAAHCFDAYKTDGSKLVYYQRKEGMFSEPGISDLKTHCYQCFKSFSDVQIHPLYVQKQIAHDIAIIRLDHDARVEDSFFISDERRPAFAGHLVAFGRSNTDELGDWFKRQGDLKVTRARDGTLVSQGDINPFLEWKNRPQRSIVPVSFSPGNSGAALTVGDSGEIVGLVSAKACYDLEKIKPETSLVAPKTHDCTYVFQASANYYVDLTRTENQRFVKSVIR